MILHFWLSGCPQNDCWSCTGGTGNSLSLSLHNSGLWRAGVTLTCVTLSLGQDVGNRECRVLSRMHRAAGVSGGDWSSSDSPRPTPSPAAALSCPGRAPAAVPGPFYFFQAGCGSRRSARSIPRAATWGGGRPGGFALGSGPARSDGVQPMPPDLGVPRPAQPSPPGFPPSPLGRKGQPRPGPPARLPAARYPCAARRDL